MTEEIKDETYFRLKEEYLSELKRLEQDSKQLTQWLDEARRNADFWCDKCTSLEQENKSLYEEKNCLHKIIDRLLENAGYSKDIASAEDFEDVYEDMQIKRNELIELEQENKELKELNKKICEDWEKEIKVYWNALEEINRVVKLAHKVEDYLLGQDYTDLVDRINEVLNVKH